MQPNKSTVKSVIKLKSTQIFIVAGTVLMTMAISLICIGLTVRYEVITDTVDAGSIPYWSMDLPPEQEEWFQRGIEDLRLTSKGTQFEHGKVKNVLVFLADGVTTDMLAGARFGEQANVKDFIWDSFPHLGVLKSSCGFMYDCDIFTIGTALFGGVQTQPGLGGLDKRVQWQNCSQANEKKYQVRSILEQAQNANLRTGFVTTKRVTSAPLSALYAHTSDTKWECDASMPKEKLLNNECQDVATQLMTGQTGQQLNVIMGGGAQTLVSRPPNDTDVDASACDSKDKRNLLQDWKSLKIETGANFKMLETSKDLKRFNGATRDFVTGIFANGNLVHREPGLKKLVSKSIEVLTRPDVGYVLVAETKAEGSGIRAFQDTLMELNETIAETIGDESFSTEDTLVLVAFMDFTQSSKDPVVPADILLFAKGPNSHLFHSIHEMTYLAHVVSYSLKMGPFRVANKLQKRTHSND
ncbi:alkaline phosphatase 4 [Stomoxys calcitrans]|uniref:alkaline phosphatase 4 n=1 Tax=Stomoxys calcitrans TaxID=35570 RepID=UPI0027E22126|nr:alkaline phosphatase 4 [Stomoxys calcitrans]